MGRTQKLPASQKLQLCNLKVHIENSQKALPIQKRFIRLVVKNVLDFLKIRTQEISIYFVTDAKIAKLHQQFFDDPTTTDCISFPLDDEILGEVFVCPSVAIRYAEKHNKDPKEETLLYMIHGILHLIGYDDLDPKSKTVMRKMERKCMNYIRKSFNISELTL